MNKKAQMLDTDVLFSPLFIALLVIGYGVFAFQLIVWSRMDFQMIWWVKIAVPLVIPIAAYIFAVINS